MNKISDRLAAVPAYFSPGPDWCRLAAGHPQVAMAVLNLEDGPGRRQDPETARCVGVATAAGIKVLGYVDTAHATRPVSEVLDEVARYVSWYGIQGVFLDQAHVSGPVVSSYYRPLYQTIKSADPKGPVVLNAGAAMPRCAMAAADVLADYEGDYQAYLQWSPPAWTSAYKANRFWHIVYGIPGLDELDRALAISQSRRAGWLYATDQAEHEARLHSHLYDRLPLPHYWTRLLQGLAQEQLASHQDAITAAPTATVGLRTQS